MLKRNQEVILVKKILIRIISDSFILEYVVSNILVEIT